MSRRVFPYVRCRMCGRLVSRESARSTPLGMVGPDCVRRALAAAERIQEDQGQ